MGEVLHIEPLQWLIYIGPKGLVCGGCRTVLIAIEQWDGHDGVPTSTQLVINTVTDHLTSCVQVEEYITRQSTEAIEDNETRKEFLLLICKGLHYLTWPPDVKPLPTCLAIFNGAVCGKEMTACEGKFYVEEDSNG